MVVITFGLHTYCSAFSKTRLPSELQRVLTCESPAVFLHTPLKEKGPWGPFYQLWQVLAKGRHLLQILLKALLLARLLQGPCLLGEPALSNTYTLMDQ